MKKILFFIVSLFFIVPLVKANSISSVNMDVYIDEVGTAHVTEVWDTYSNEGTEFYKPYENLGTSVISNLVVKNQDTTFTTLTSWNIDSSFSDKSYKAGINYISDGIEICMGISKYGVNKFTFTYDITNFVINTNDSQMAYWTLMPENMNPAPKTVYIKIHSDFDYANDLDLWGYGNYGGTAYVYDGYIEVEQTDFDSSKYMVVLIKFNSNTFSLSESLDNDFEYYSDMANEGSTAYTESNNVNFWSVIFNPGMLFFIFMILSTIGGTIKHSSSNYKNISKEDRLPNKVEYFREIPCNKDIFKSFFISNRYSLIKKETDFLGTVLLNWILNKKIVIIKGESKILKKEITKIQFFDNVLFENELEEKLYGYMKEAAVDDYLEDKEFEKWCKTNYKKMIDWFKDIFEQEGKKLLEQNVITKEETKFLNVIPYKKNVYNISIKEDGIKLKGLKNFLNDFSQIKDKTALEVNSWEYYLMYAQIFGIAKKVAKEFKDLYPDLINDTTYDSFIFINMIAYSGISSANSAYSRAQSYNAGGGGFSSGGGGGGSFGGGFGGGGSR